MTSDTRPAAAGGIRRLLLGIVFVGIVGTMTELLLLGHFADAVQLTPLLLLSAGLVVAIWQAAAPGVASLRMFQLVMVLFLSNGLVGIGYHYGGNEIAAREDAPSTGGGQLFRRALVGDAPVLAPGSMVMLGLVGLVFAYRHPLLSDRDPDA